MAETMSSRAGRQDTLALEGRGPASIAGGAGALERPFERELVHTHAARLQRQHHRRLALVGVAALGDGEQPFRRRPQAAHVQHQKVGCAIGNLVDRLFGRDAGVQDDEAPDAVAAQVAQQLGQQGLEGRGRQMLAAGKRREGRVEAEAHDGCRNRRQALDQPLGQGAGGQRIGLERQVRAVRLGRRADRNHDQPPGNRPWPRAR